MTAQLGPDNQSVEEVFPTSKPEGWTSDKWATPWDIVESFENEFGRPFDLDPCAEVSTAKAPKFFTIEEDGLSHRWHGNVFVNPPFSNVRPWIDKAHHEVCVGNADLVVMLLPAAVDGSMTASCPSPNLCPRIKRISFARQLSACRRLSTVTTRR